MTAEEIRVVFSNISDLAVFSDNLSELLQEALGSVVDGYDDGDDHVGALFLRIVCSF